MARNSKVYFTIIEQRNTRKEVYFKVVLQSHWLVFKDANERNIISTATISVVHNFVFINRFFSRATIPQSHLTCLNAPGTSVSHAVQYYLPHRMYSNAQGK